MATPSTSAALRAVVAAGRRVSNVKKNKKPAPGRNVPPKGVITRRGAAAAAAVTRKQKVRQNQVQQNRQRQQQARRPQAPANPGKGRKGQKPQAPARPEIVPGIGIPELPDLSGMVQDVPTYDQLGDGGVPSWQDFVGMAMQNYTPSSSVTTRDSYRTGGGGGGGGGAGSPGFTPTPAMDNITQLAQGFAGSYGGGSNVGSGDIAGMAPAIQNQLQSSIDAMAQQGQAGTSGGGGGGGSSSESHSTTTRTGASPNPYTAAATMQKMAQAEAMFGPKLMGQYLQNQGYSINNMKDYQSAMIDYVMFGPKYTKAYADAQTAGLRTTGQALTNRGKAMAIQITGALAGPKIKSQQLTNKSKQADIRGKNARLKAANIKLKYDIVSKNQQIANRAVDAQLKQMEITSKGLRIKAQRAQLKANKKGQAGGYTTSQWNSLAKTAATMAYNNYSATDNLGLPKPVPYKVAYKRMIAANIPPQLATTNLNSYYKPGQHGRPSRPVKKTKIKR